MTHSSLWLSVYNLIWGNSPHWALKVTQRGSDTYYLQIFGEPGTFYFNEARGADPVTASHRKDIQIWDLDSPTGIERVRAAARGMRIDMETVFWSCQDWCIDVIKELEEGLVVAVEEDGDGEDLAEWKRLKRKLVKEMGPDI